MFENEQILCKTGFRLIETLLPALYAIFIHFNRNSNLFNIHLCFSFSSSKTTVTSNTSGHSPGIPNDEADTMFPSLSAKLSV